MNEKGKKNISTAVIKDNIRKLEAQLSECREQLELAKQEEFRDALETFLTKFDIHTSEDVKRIEKILEDIENIAQKNPRSLRKEKMDMDRDFTAAKADPEPALELHDEFGKYHKEEQRNCYIQSPPSEDDTMKQENDPEDEKDLQPAFDWESLTDEVMESTEESLINEELSNDTMLPESGTAIDSETDEQQSDPESLWAALEADFTMGVEPDNSKIDVSTVISVSPEDPSLAKFKERPAVVNAEKTLVEAIALAVEEGWVQKGNVDSTFFDTSAYGFDEGDFYANAQKVCESLDMVWKDAGQTSSKSGVKFQEFYHFPFHVKCKAVALAKNDLAASL